ncbi:MAG: hypothetical protein SGPRY_013060, partial [Prymnesium sp.]
MGELLNLMHRVDEAHARHALRVDCTARSLPDRQLLDEERHMLQHKSFVDALERNSLASQHTSIVEFGSGDAALSRAAWKAGAGGRFCLIDKNPRRAEQWKNIRGFVPKSICADVAQLDPDELRETVEPGPGPN